MTTHIIQLRVISKSPTVKHIDLLSLNISPRQASSLTKLSCVAIRKHLSAMVLCTTPLCQGFSIGLAGPFYSLFAWCSDWCSALLICVNDNCWSVYCVQVWHWPCGQGHCWLLTPSASFAFQSQPHECEESSSKLITLWVGGGQEKEEGASMQSRSFFLLLFFTKSAPLFPLSSLSASPQWMALQAVAYLEWHKFISVAPP